MKYIDTENNEVKEGTRCIAIRKIDDTTTLIYRQTPDDMKLLLSLLENKECFVEDQDQPIKGLPFTLEDILNPLMTCHMTTSGFCMGDCVLVLPRGKTCTSYKNYEFDVTVCGCISVA